MPAHNTIQQTYTPETSLDILSTAITSALASIEGVSSRPLQSRGLHSFPNDLCLDVLVSATGDTWSRAARRRQMRGATMEVDEETAQALVCRVTCAACSQGTGSSGGAVLQCHWVKGRDRTLFESFASHLSRKVSATLSTTRT